MKRNLHKAVLEHRTSNLKCLPMLCICMVCLVLKGCVPENISLPGASLNTPSDTVVASPITVPEAFTNYFETGLSLGYTADEVEVVFKVDIDWMMQVVDDADNSVTWCSLSTDLGSAGLHKVKVGVKENLVRASRSARIVLRSLDASKMAEIAVVQEGVTLFLERTDYKVAPHDTTLAVELKANVDFEYKIVDADWVHEQPSASRALTTHSVAFTIDANPSHKSREAHILFYNSQYPVAADTLTIVQQGLTPTVTIPDGYTDYFAEDLIFSHVKGEAEVAFHSNVDWTLQLVAASGESTSWCSVDQSSGKIGLQKVKVRVTDNDTYAHRSLILRLMCDTITMGEILVLQERENAILLGRKDYTVSYEATTIDVSLSTNVDFEYKILDADWVREQQSATRSLTTHNFTFEVDENDSRKEREAHILFYNSEYAVADTLTLVQEGDPYEAVDLGLSVKWANCNVGAKSPEEYGDYFAWGETTTKSDYSSSTSVTYGLFTSELESRGIIGSDGNLTTEYDAATANWGSPWRMPTGVEQDELRNNCTWSWTTQNGVNGYKVTGPNGNSIFLPAAGYRLDTSLYDVDSRGTYWSATPNSYSYYACRLDFYSGNFERRNSLRYYGFAVRPVSE